RTVLRPTMLRQESLRVATSAITLVINGKRAGSTLRPGRCCSTRATVALTSRGEIGCEAMPNGIETTKDHFEPVAETIVCGATGCGHSAFTIELAGRAVGRALQHVTRLSGIA